MARVILSNNETFTVFTSNNTQATDVFGRSGGSETVLIAGSPTATGVVNVTQDIERVDFRGAVGDYTYLAAGNTVSVQSNGLTIATIVIQEAVGTKAAFSDGSAVFTTGTGGTRLGGAVLAQGTSTLISAAAIGASNFDTSATGRSAAVNLGTTTPPVSTAQTFTLTSSAATVNEGASVVYTVTTRNVAAGSYNYLLGGTGVTSSDVVGGLTGSVAIDSSGTGYISVTAAADNATEGTETLTVTIGGSVSSTSVQVLDTSTTPAPVALNYALTTLADAAFAGGAANDLWTGSIGTDGVAANGTTLGAGDNISDTTASAGDKLSLSISGTNTAAVTTSSFTVSGVEILDIANYETSGFDNTINMSLVTGLTNVNVTGSSATGDTLLTGVRGLVAASMANGSGDLSLTYLDTVLAGTTALNTAETQSLTLSGQTAGTFIAQPTATGAAETLSITSSGSANSVTVTVPGATTINIAGDQGLTLAEGMTNTITRVNASTLTGALSFTTDDSTVISVTGGSGNDTINLGGTFTSADSIDGGAGNADRLQISTAITTATALANVTNVEQLVVTGGAAITLAAAVVPTTFTVSDAVASVVTFNAGYTGAPTVNMGVTDSVVNSANVATTLNVTTANAVSGAGITITGGTGVDTLNITADATGTGTAFTLGNVSALDRIVVVDGGDTAATAGSDIAITVGAAYATSLTVDASALDAGLTSGASTDLTNENLLFTGSAQSTAATVLSVTGGGGLDTIIGGAGNDILSGGAGNDSINGATGGNDSILGGDGVDTINMGAALTSADTIDGGSGNDTLVVTSLTAAGLTNVTNVETLALAGAASTATLSANLSFTTIDMDTADNTAQVLTTAAGFTNALTVLVDAGDSVVNGANVALTVQADGASLVAGSVTTLTGGTGNDALSVLADNTTANIVATANLITGFDSITVRDFGDSTTVGSVTAGRSLTLDLTSYATATTRLVVDASALDAGTGTNLATNAEVFTITGTSARALAVTGGGASDTIVGSSNATLGDSLVGGDGNDTFTMASNLDYLDTIDGGAGSLDLITVGNALLDINLMRVTNVEQITLGATGNVLSSYFDTTGITTVNLWTTAGTVNAAGTQLAHTFASTAAVNESVAGGLGVDTFVFNATGTLDSNDSLNGGAGNDILLLTNAAGSVAGTVDFDNVLSVETVTLGTASGSSASTAQTITLTVDTLTLATAQTITLNGSVVTDSNDAITVNNNAATTTTRFSITGGAGADVLAGSGANDTISGGGGADSITGGAGVDSLTGGAGNDAFVFVTTDSTNAATDVISDFTSGSDRIQITAATVASGATVDYSYKGAAATNADAIVLLSSRVGQYYLNSTSGTLILDTDGNGLAQSSDFAVTLSSLTTLGALDVQVTITDAAGAESITTGSGNDTINMTNTTANTADSVNAGAGDDTINTVRASLNDTTSDTINGGAGNDTLNIAGTAGTIAVFGSDAALAGIENININTAGSTLDLSAQTEAFNIAMVSTASTAGVTLAAAAHTVTGGTGDDTVTLASRAALVAAASINGGAGTDSIVVSAASTAFVDADFAKVASVESLTLTGASSIVLGATATTAGIATVVTGNAATSITSTQAALAVTGTALATTSVLTLLGTANYTVTSGGTTHDRITATGSSGTLNATFGNAGSNGVTVATGTGNTVIVGGDAGDTITVTGLATAGQTFTGSVASFVVTAGAGAQTITTGVAADTITGGAGADTMNVGSGTDRVVIASADISTTAGNAAAATFAATGDVIIGLANGNGAGTDTLDLDVTGFTGGNLANLTVAAAANLAGAGAITNAAANVLLHNAAVAGDFVVGGVVQAAAVTAALNIITTAGAGTNSATTSDLYVAIYDSGAGALADLAIFKVDHAAGSANIATSEVTFVGVLVDFAAALTNGFVV